MWQTYRRLRETPLREFPTYLAEITQQYGPAVSFRVPWRRFYFFSDPQAVKDVLVTHQHAFVKSEGTRAMRALLGHGLVTSEDPLHRRMRRIVQPAFHRERIAAYARTMEDYARAWSPPSRVFDMHAEMMELTLRIASKTLFGADAGEEADTVAAALHEVVTIFPDVLGPLGAVKRRLPFGPMPRFRQARRALDRIVQRLVAVRRRSGEDRGDALSMLLAVRDEETGLALEDDQIRDEVMTLFVAGHETTANALTWAWYLLAKNPAIGQQLRAQLAHDVNAPLLDAVLNETLRLYPPAWILGRDATREIAVAGWRIRRGATVLLSQLIMHRSPDFFENPERFVPQRWIGDLQLAALCVLPIWRRIAQVFGRPFCLDRSSHRAGNFGAPVSLRTGRSGCGDRLRSDHHVASARPGADARSGRLNAPYAKTSCSSPAPAFRSAS